MKFIMILALTCQFALAQDESTTTSTKVEGSESTANDKADEVITNRRFRAANGSLSKLSMNLSLGYSGGSLQKPFDAQRPNLVNSGNTASVASAGGSIGASYRLNKLNRLNLGFGVQMLAPFHDSLDSDDPVAKREFRQNQGELDASNPFVSYTNLANIAGVQTISTIGLTHYTAGQATDLGYAQMVSGSVNTMYNFGGSDFSVGALAVAEYNTFDDNDARFQSSQNEVVFGILPQAEYVLDETFNLRTIIRSHWYQNTTEAPTVYKRRPITQSVGLGISLGRNVFLYPNIQFGWEEIKAENTNVGLSANINLF